MLPPRLQKPNVAQPASAISLRVPACACWMHTATKSTRHARAGSISRDEQAPDRRSAPCVIVASRRLDRDRAGRGIVADRARHSRFTGRVVAVVVLVARLADSLVLRGGCRRVPAGRLG